MDNAGGRSCHPRVGMVPSVGFAGGLHDRDLGFVRFGWRDYDVKTGRWTAPDPIGEQGGDPDWYGYCLDDPVSRPQRPAQSTWVLRFTLSSISAVDNRCDAEDRNHCHNIRKSGKPARRASGNAPLSWNDEIFYRSRVMLSAPPLPSGSSTRGSASANQRRFDHGYIPNQRRR